jgi:hypothetical protein
METIFEDENVKQIVLEKVTRLILSDTKMVTMMDARAKQIYDMLSRRVGDSVLPTIQEDHHEEAQEQSPRLRKKPTAHSKGGDYGSLFDDNEKIFYKSRGVHYEFVYNQSSKTFIYKNVGYNTPNKVVAQIIKETNPTRTCTAENVWETCYVMRNGVMTKIGCL